MISATALTDTVAELSKTFAGQLLQPADAGYDDARNVHNGLIDKRPALIARCRCVADIVDAIKLAREQKLEVAVRGGGHNVAGLSTIDGGVMIDLSPMTGIRVDPKARTAQAQGGLTWNLFNRETQLHGLAVTGGVISTTGIAGLTLGGGLGWLMGKHALALDNLLSVDLVLADGNAVTASNDDNADLFWALRGVTASLPDEFTVFAGLIHAPDGSGTKLAAMVLCHCGALAAGERAAQPIKQFGAPVMDVIGAMPYSAINSMLDAAYPRGALNYWKSNFLASLSDEAIHAMIDCFAQCPTPMGQLLIEHFHGAVTRVGTTDTAFPHRAEGYNLLVLSEWMDTKDNDACTAWARNSYAAMQPFMSSNRYVNYLADDERGDAVAASYGPNYRRLQQLKAKYDPENFFHMNHNIRPVP